MLTFQNILHPTDFSPRSDYAFRLACALARDHGASVTVLHVLPLPIAVFGNGIVPAEPENLREQVKEKLRQMAAPAPGVRIERLLVEGDPANEVLRMAKEKKCDLIVMGTHGWTGLTRLLMGSVAEKVVRKSPCAVLTVKTPLGEEAAAQPEAAKAVLEPAKT